MIQIQARLDELSALGLHRRTRLVSGPQGPHALVDGRPALLLCSDNALGFADHPRVRDAAAEAAMRWGVGAGAARPSSGTMTIHRRLEERVAELTGQQRALLFGSGYLANAGVIPALARAGDVIFSDELNHPSIVDGCRLSGAEVFVYAHGDAEHLRWGVEHAEGRGAVIATESVFGLDGDVAPLPDIVALARRHGIRTVIDESHAIGTVGPGGRGAVAQAGLEDDVDAIVGTLGGALGSYGAFVACERSMARYLTSAARTFLYSTAPPPPTIAGALAALDLLAAKPHRVARLAANAAALRAALEREGFGTGPSQTHVMALWAGDATVAIRVADEALARGVLGQPILPPAVAHDAARLRLSVMATHREEELRDAARTIASVARAAGMQGRLPTDAAIVPIPDAGQHAEADDDDGTAPGRRAVAAALPPPRAGVFDFEADAPARRAA